MLTRRAKYVVVTGAIAAGASTLSELLVTRYNWGELLEGDVAAENPFFQRVYQHPQRWILSSQLHFLTASVERHRRLAEMLEEAGPEDVILEDRTPFEHTAAYTETYRRLGRVPADEAALLDRTAEIFEQHYLVPDLLVYRQMDHNQLLARVQERGREGESQADIALLDGVRQSFDMMMERWDRCDLLSVHPAVDVKDSAQFEKVATAIHSRIFPNLARA